MTEADRYAVLGNQRFGILGTIGGNSANRPSNTRAKGKNSNRPRLERYQEIYLKTGRDGPSRMSRPGIVCFVVRPTWIRHSDFDQNPRLILEFTFTIRRAHRV